MDNSSSRAEAMKPVILKAGIPLAVSVAGLILARFMTRRADNQGTSTTSNPCAGQEEEEEEETGVIEDSRTQGKREHEEEIVSLKTRFEELQKKEFELERRFLHYCNLRDQEYVLMELENMLKLEKAYLEFFRTDVSSLEAENKNIQDWLMIYLNVLEESQGLRSENSLLQRKVKRLTRRTKKLSRVMKEKNMKIGNLERELLRSLDELETKSKAATKMEEEEEVRNLENVIKQLQEEKNELQSKLLGSKSQIEELLKEHEIVQRDRADEAKELIYLRWSNACLRHELMRNHGYDQENKTDLEEIDCGEDAEFRNAGFRDQTSEGLALEHGGDERNHQNHDPVCSKKKRLLKKLKRWVEGNEKEKSKIDEKCIERSCVANEPEEEDVTLARRFCSSV